MRLTGMPGQALEGQYEESLKLSSERHSSGRTTTVPGFHAQVLVTLGKPDEAGRSSASRCDVWTNASSSSR